MEDMARRRLGKGVGGKESDALPIEDSQAQDSGTARREEPVDDAGRESPRPVDSGIAGNGGAESSRAVAIGNPFWSQKARDELQLQLARPDFLGNATASSS